LETVSVNLRGAVDGGQPIWTPFVTRIDHDAKGQRTRIDYGNGVATTYDTMKRRSVFLRLSTTRKTGGTTRHRRYSRISPPFKMFVIRMIR